MAISFKRIYASTFQLPGLCNQSPWLRGRPLLMHVFTGDSWTAAAAAKSLQSCLILWDPIDGSLPGSPVPGILQARTLELVAISFSNAWQWKWKWNRSVMSVSYDLMVCSLAGSSVHGIFPGKSTGHSQANLAQSLMGHKFLKYLYYFLLMTQHESRIHHPKIFLWSTDCFKLAIFR